MKGAKRRWRTDCRFFPGDRPCAHRRECEGCDLHEPWGRRVLVLKIGAIGDVLRTTPILRPLAGGSASPVHVTWVVGEAARPLLNGHPRIDRVLTPGAEADAILAVEDFDLLLSLDKDPWPTARAMTVTATEKRGFGRDRNGVVIPLHPSAEYAWELGLSDRLKFQENQRVYQDLIGEVCGIPWDGEEYDVPAPADDSATGRRILESAGIAVGSGPLVGFNTGAGGIFANKAWTGDAYATLAGRLAAEGCRVALLGGRAEAERNERIARLSEGAAVDTGFEHSLPEFAGLISHFDLVVTGDTLGMHLAIAGRVPVVALFGSTCPQEIELYGRGEKIITPMDCHPCYRHTCDLSPGCQDLIPVDAVHEAVRRILT
ncbi:MAG: glycosyltransferase family 9 protein [Gemmatimonadota bacterium]|jgi:heptosyltransferase-2|nr:glycosyltransferase family 9 protein [Gemmatimonadota bacterium]MDP6801720.1 glycosyltransferase family 9 protein [Gemmatimonadota bacterium]MDP7031204.1 glycosyltransferase family 9 protein [Gemmatimonadota bacterium]